MPETINEWLAAIAMLISVANAAWLWLSRPARDLGVRVDAMEELAEKRHDAALEAMKGHDRRIQRVENDLNHLPTKDDLHRVSEQVARIKTELDLIAKVVTRIDNFLRNEGSR